MYSFDQILLVRAYIQQLTFITCLYNRNPISQTLNFSELPITPIKNSFPSLKYYIFTLGFLRSPISQS